MRTLTTLALGAFTLAASGHLARADGDGSTVEAAPAPAPAGAEPSTEAPTTASTAPSGEPSAGAKDDQVATLDPEAAPERDDAVVAMSDDRAARGEDAEPAARTDARADHDAKPERTSRFPRTVIDRPAILPFGVVRGLADFEATGSHLDSRFRVAGGLPGGLDATVGYERRMIAAAEDRGAGHLTAAATVPLAHASPWLVAAGASFDFHLDDRALGGAALGVLLERRLSSRVEAWLRPEQLVWDLRADTPPPAVILPVSVGVQITRHVAAQVDGDLKLGELRDGRLVRATAAMPVSLAAIASLSPAIDLQLGLASALGEDGFSGPATCLVGVAYTVGH